MTDSRDLTFYIDDMSHTDRALQFNESFERCVNDPRFLDKFYEIFLSSSDEVNLMFRDTDMETQKVMLDVSTLFRTQDYTAFC